MSDYYIYTREDGTTYLSHSAKGTSWTKKDHKYLKKIGEGANAIYQYAKNKSGVGLKKDIERKNDEIADYEWESKSEALGIEANRYNTGVAQDMQKAAIRNGSERDRKYYEGLTQSNSKKAWEAEKRKNAADANKKKAEKEVAALYEKYSNSALGKAEATIKRGKEAISDFFNKKDKSKVTVTFK